MDSVKEYKYDFCTIQHRDDNILVFEIEDGIEVDADMTTELYHRIDEIMSGPFGALSNRINSYSLTFEAMTAIAQYDNMAAIAIVIHDAKSRMLVEAQNYLLLALKKKPIKIFMDTDSAINWLHATLQTSSASAQTTTTRH